MGFVTATSETAFNYSADVIYAFVTNPHNWARTYKGSGGVSKEKEIELPLKIGDEWTEVVNLEHNTYHSKWKLITAIPGRKWVFQQINGIGNKEDGTGGVDGICTISYTFLQPGEDVTLFSRTLSIELPKGVGMPDDLLTVCMRPDGIDRYHASIKAELDKEHSKK